MSDNKNFNSDTDNTENREKDEKAFEDEQNKSTGNEKNQGTENTDDREKTPEDDSDVSESRRMNQSEKESNSITESSEDEENTEQDYNKLPDYKEKTREELLDILGKLTEDLPTKETARQVEHIKKVFGKKTAEYKAVQLQEREKERKKLREEGKEDELAEEIPEDPLPQTLEKLLKQFKQKQKEAKQKEQEQREKNLQIKKQIIQNIENLINKPEAFGKTFNEFREFQKQWNETGPVPKNENRNIWTEYNQVTENFYNYVQINKELRDLDLQKNTEAKKQLCEEAEALLEKDDIMDAQRKLQKMHDRWRETGPVYNEIKEELWERFKKPTKIINEKHQERLKLIKEQQEKNLESKTYLCEKAEEALEKEYRSNSEWKKASALVQKYQKLWNSIGYVPKQHNQAIYERFSTACDKFFDRMRAHFEKVNAERQENLVKKKELLEQAKERAESTDWSKDTKFYKNIQKQWKKIGPVPRKHSDKIWKEFRSACNTFFDRKREHFNQRKQDEKENLELKNRLIEEMENYNSSGDENEDLKKIKEFQNRWQEIGFVPIKEKDRVIKRYNKALDDLFDRSAVDKGAKVNIKLSKKMQALENADEDRIWGEIGKLRAKIDEREKEINLWKNNLGFFSDDKASEEMKAEYLKKIERGEKEIAEYRAMINKLQNLQ